MLAVDVYASIASAAFWAISGSRAVQPLETIQAPVDQGGSLPLVPFFRLERARVLRDRRQRIDRKLVTFEIEEIGK